MIQDLQRDQAQHLQTDSSDDDIREVEARNGLYDKISGMAERFAGTRIGQFVIERCDQLLRSIEETAKWSLPKDTLRVKLVRPFNWFIFLMLIVLLRLIRVSLSVGALLIGNRPVTAHDMVYFLQTRRRKLRAIRLDGLRNMQRREEETTDVLRFGGTGCFTSRISALLSIAICQPGQHCLPRGHVFAQHGFVRNESGKKDETDQHTIARQPATEQCDDHADHNLTFDQMLSKYVDIDSEDDPDFVPQPDEEESSDESSTSTSTSDRSTNKNTTEEKDDDQAEAYSNTLVTQNAAQQKAASNEEKEPNESSKSLNNSWLDQSVEIRNNDSHPHHIMPKPIVLKIKREPLSDIDSGSEQPSQKRHIAENEQPASRRRQDQEEKEQEAPQKDNISPSIMINDNELSPQVDGLEKSANTTSHLPALGTTAVAAPSNDDSPDTSSFSSLSPSTVLSSLSEKLTESGFRGRTKSEGTANAAERWRSPSSSLSLSPSPPPPATPPSTPHETPLSTPPTTPTTPLSAVATSSTAATLIFEPPLTPLPPPPPQLPARSTPSAPPAVAIHEKSALTAASSSEDIFYSPIGSPPTFDACFSPPASILKNSDVNTASSESTEMVFAPAAPQINEDYNTTQSFLPTAAASTVTEASSSPPPPPPPPPPKKFIPQQSKRNRSRGRNRR